MRTTPTVAECAEITRRINRHAGLPPRNLIAARVITMRNGRPGLVEMIAGKQRLALITDPIARAGTIDLTEGPTTPEAIAAALATAEELRSADCAKRAAIRGAGI